MKEKVYLWLFVIYLVAIGLYMMDLFKSFEYWIINHHFFIKYLLSEEQKESPIVIVGIDENSLKELGRWPWPRETHIALLKELKKAGAKVVGMDLIFDQPYDAMVDRSLAETMEKIGVVLPITLDLTIYRGFLGEEIEVNKIYRPLPVFDRVSRAGHINLIPDLDGAIRRGFNYLDGVPSFALQIAKLYQPEVTYPDQPFWINYPGPARSYPTYSYVDILKGNYPRNLFVGKIVLVGALDPALGDQFVTPFSQFGLISGVEIHAHQLNTLLTGDYIKPLPLHYGLILLTIIALMSGYSAFRWKPITKLSVFILFSIGYYLCSFYFFINHNLLLPYFPILFFLGGSLIVGMLVSYFLSNKEKARLYETFHRYLAPQVLQQVLDGTKEIELGGEEKKAAVLFIDIRGFTAYAHSHRPKEVVDLLNQYLKLFAEVIFAFEGTLDKYLGDGLMAVFGAPVEGKDDLKRAFFAALEILKKVIEKELPLPVGMGLAYGPVISGNIGSYKRMDFTVIGDTVNTASRLEELAGPGELVMTEEVGKLLDITEELTEEKVEIKGIEGMITIYRLKKE
ncbi:hypothetical protein BBF96_10850 [Anoxybacter fermentans]|uniref:Guanylate cyclase domain-containing protein n=1 Tax=Anoxybacter fermentans TaxID=1323375 RepID=A0A3Q9HR43_9FIRM|nr:adenylate/guanylate cyclase domain-containing protein [Anoxybacter fermentans]AZR73840.1 hypothetical protein BBF96_10850 [Anoxybacter fermentans]